MKNIMESSETLAHLPLDFSVTMMNLKLKNELNNNSSMVLSQNNHQTSSAFKVVTPRGKSDGKSSERKKQKKNFAWVEKLLRESEER